jgi:hypothetical protein
MSRAPQRLTVGRWALQLAPGWQAELEEGCACVTKHEGVGVLLISHADKAGAPVARDELRRLADAELPGDADVGASRMGDFEGLHATYVASDARWHRFYLSFGTLLLLATYTVELSRRTACMLRSLRALGDRWE